MRRAQIEDEQDRKADHLRDGGRKPRAVHTHAELMNEKPVAENVEQSPRGQTDHRVKRLALIAQIVVQHQRADHKRTGDQHPHAVVAGVGKDGFGASEKSHERF